MRRRSRTAVSSSAFLGAKNCVAAHSGLLREGGLRVDADRLSEDEQREFVDLVREASGEYGAWSFDHLDGRKRKRLEKLIEQGSDSRGLFERKRQEAEVRALATSAFRAAAKPKPPSVPEEERLLALLHRLVAQRSLHIDRLGIFVYLLGQILAADPISPGARIEGSGDGLTLVLSSRLGLGMNHDPYEQMTRWRDALSQLDRVGLLEVSGQGNELRVRLGSLALRALGRPVSTGRAAA